MVDCEQEGSFHLNDVEKSKQLELCDSRESDNDKALFQINIAGSVYSPSSPKQNIANWRTPVLPVEDQESLD